MIHKIFSRARAMFIKPRIAISQIAIPPPTRVVRVIMKATDHSNTL
jgi:hypothetical protein